MSKVLKKILCLIFALLTLTACLIVPASAAYENTYKNTGDQRKDIVGVAKTQVGNTNGSKYCNSGSAWCAYFVVWCARQAGIDSSIIKNTGWACAADLGVTYKGRSADRKTGINYTPLPGDIIIFDWSYDGYNYASPASEHGDHVGIVVEVKNGMVYTIEGNSSGKVREKSYSLNSSEIKGYGVPKYKTTSGSQSAANNSSSAVTKTYTIRSSYGATVRTGAGTSNSSVGALAKGSVVYYDKTKTANGFTWFHIVKVNAKAGSWGGSFVGRWVANV